MQHKVAKVRSFDYSGKVSFWEGPGQALAVLNADTPLCLLAQFPFCPLSCLWLPPAMALLRGLGAVSQRCPLPKAVHTHGSPTSPQDTEQDHEPPYEISVQEEVTARLHFVKFENTYIEACLDFIKDHLVNTETKVIQATGGGAYKFKDLIEEKLQLK